MSELVSNLTNPRTFHQGSNPGVPSYTSATLINQRAQWLQHPQTDHTTTHVFQTKCFPFLVICMNGVITAAHSVLYQIICISGGINLRFYDILNLLYPWTSNVFDELLVYLFLKFQCWAIAFSSNQLYSLIREFNIYIFFR